MNRFDRISRLSHVQIEMPFDSIWNSIDITSADYFNGRDKSENS